MKEEQNTFQLGRFIFYLFFIKSQLTLVHVQYMYMYPEDILTFDSSCLITPKIQYFLAWETSNGTCTCTCQGTCMFMYIQTQVPVRTRKTFQEKHIGECTAFKCTFWDRHGYIA